MEKCKCAKCGALIEIAAYTNFVTCPDCQTELKVNRLEEHQNLEQIQDELNLSHQQLDALSNEWQKKHPQMLPNSEHIQSYFEDKETTLPYALYLVGGLSLSVAMGMGFYGDSPLIAVFALLCSIAASVWGYSVASSIKKQKLSLVGEAKSQEKKIADLKKKITELEQKLR